MMGSGETELDELPPLNGEFWLYELVTRVITSSIQNTFTICQEDSLLFPYGMSPRHTTVTLRETLILSIARHKGPKA